MTRLIFILALIATICPAYADSIVTYDIHRGYNLQRRDPTQQQAHPVNPGPKIIINDYAKAETDGILQDKDNSGIHCISGC